MKVVILAAGYGTRLTQDFKTKGHKEEKIALADLPKGLLPIAGKPLIEYWLQEITKLSLQDETFIVTNETYYPKFEQWSFQHSFPIQNIIKNGSFGNQYRKGSFFDFYDFLQIKKIDDAVLVIASDTLFYPTFSLSQSIDTFHKNTFSIITCYEVPDHKVPSHGIVELDQNDMVTNFKEKPQPHATPSRFACPTFYILTKEAIAKIKSTPPEEESFDSIGKAVSYIHQTMPVKAIKIEGRFDIGDLEGYRAANDFFEKIKDQQNLKTSIF